MPATKVYYDTMRETDAFCSRPICGLLKIVSLIGRTVHTIDLFAVGIIHSPRFAGYAFSGSIKKIKFCDCRVVAAVDRIDRLKNHITSGALTVESTLLPAVAGIE